MDISIHLKVIHCEFPEVCECRKPTQGVTVESEHGMGTREQAEMQFLDEWEQTKIIWCLEQMFPVCPGMPAFGNCEGFVKMGYCGDVQRMACLGTRKEGVLVVDEEDNHFHKLLREFDGSGWKFSGCPRGDGQLLYLDSVSIPELVVVPELVSKQCDICIGVNVTQSSISEAVKQLCKLT